MIFRAYPAAAAVLAVVALDACGGGGGSSAVPVTPIATVAPTAGPTSSPAPQIVQSFKITVPAKTTSSALRRPRYVSPNTGSVRITVQTVNGGPASVAATIAKIASGAPGCATYAGGSLSCTVAANAAVGIDVFAISTYASSDASGTPLATTAVAETVTATAGAPVALSLGGVPAQIAFSPAFLPLSDDGQIRRYPVTLNAVDASGTTIVGADPYQTAISLQILGDPTHALSLSTASVTQPGTVITVTFDGSKSLVQGIVQATATGVAPVTLAAAPMRIAPQGLVIYDDQSGGGNATVTQAGFTGTFTAALANAQDGTVGISAGPLQSGSAVATIVPKTIFDVTTLTVGNGTYTSSVPVTIVPHPGKLAMFGSQHRVLSATSLVQAPNGLFWTADGGSGSIVSFDPSSGTYTSNIVDTSGTGPQSLAVDANGKIWFTDDTKIGSFDPTTQSVSMFTTGLSATPRVISIIAGAPGTMWFYDEETNLAPARFGKPSAFGKISTATGTITEFPSPTNASPVVAGESMTIGPDGALWFADGSNHAIGRVDSSGNYSSVAINSTTSPNLEPHLVVTGPDGKVWFGASNYGLGQSELGTIDPSSKAIAHYAIATPGEFKSLIVGSDHNIWYTQWMLTGVGFAPNMQVGIFNPSTHATYEYDGLLPDFGVVTGMIDRGDRTLWMLDNAFGQIGKVTFK